MAGRVALDTTFLIDLQRERRRGDGQGPAQRFLERDRELRLHLPAVALGEFAEGFEDPGHPVLQACRELHVLLEVDEETALHYGRITRSLRREGRLPGSNDLWIAATALRHELPLVTRDGEHFGRVEGLEILGYG